MIYFESIRSESRLKALEHGQVHHRKHPPTSDWSKRQQGEDMIEMESLRQVITAYREAARTLQTESAPSMRR